MPGEMADVGRIPIEFLIQNSVYAKNLGNRCGLPSLDHDEPVSTPQPCRTTQKNV